MITLSDDVYLISLTSQLYIAALHRSFTTQLYFMWAHCEAHPSPLNDAIDQVNLVTYFSCTPHAAVWWCHNLTRFNFTPGYFTWTQSDATLDVTVFLHNEGRTWRWRKDETVRRSLGDMHQLYTTQSDDFGCHSLTLKNSKTFTT